MEININNINETKILAEIFSGIIKEKGGFIKLLGDIGAGKTAFCRFLIQSLGAENDVTSPSFVILNEYKTKSLPVYHFDLYRLEDTGVKSITEELREYSKDNVLTLVEWAEFGGDELPLEHLTIKIEYDLENIDEKRKFTFYGTNTYYKNIIQKLKEKFDEHLGV